MNKKFYADIEYSRKLAHLFPDADAYYGVWEDGTFIYSSDDKEKWKWNDWKERLPALHTDMLWDKLPRNIKYNGVIYITAMHKSIDPKGHSRVVLFHDEEKNLLIDFLDKKPPNALSKCLFWLDKEGLIDDC